MNDKTFLAGDTVFLAESMRWIREAKVLRVDDDSCVIRFTDNGGGIRTRLNRLYATKKDAEAEIKTAKAARSASEKPVPKEEVPKVLRDRLTLLAIRDSCKF